MLHMFDNNVKLSWFVDPGLTEWTVIFITTWAALIYFNAFTFFKDTNMHLEKNIKNQVTVCFYIWHLQGFCQSHEGQFKISFNTFLRVKKISNKSKGTQ